MYEAYSIARETSDTNILAVAGVFSETLWLLLCSTHPNTIPSNFKQPGVCERSHRILQVRRSSELMVNIPSYFVHTRAETTKNELALFLILSFFIFM